MALESGPDNPQPLREIAKGVKSWIDRLGWVWVEAQVLQINRRAGTRTVFLTLRDPLAEVSVSVTMSPLDLDAAGPLTEGATVVAHLKASYYTPAGRLSFVCDDLRPVGEGRLLAMLEQRKRMLQAEGLFDPRRKRPLPFLPRGIALITGAESAAERDVLEHVRRRLPSANIVSRHALMQGQQAARDLMEAVRALDRDPGVDVIIIARGGGSLEDLLPFSDEGLLREVAACTTPVISAIGHESDSPILDLVADVRASTPTDAAKRVVPDVAEEKQRLSQAAERIRHAIGRQIAYERQQLESLRRRPVLLDPTATFALQRDTVRTSLGRVQQAVRNRLDTERTLIRHQRQRAKAMSPVATLERGYAIIATQEGETVTSVRGQADADLVAHLSDGQLLLSVIDAIEAVDQLPESEHDETDPEHEETT